MKKTRYHRCCLCDNKATWLYMPSSNGRVFYCNDHVPRGCQCNDYDIEMDGDPTPGRPVAWWTKEDSSRQPPFCLERQKDSFFYQYLDEKGRLYPCVEYDYDEEGFEVPPFVTLVDVTVIRKAIRKTVVSMRLSAARKKYVDELGKMANGILNSPECMRHKNMIDYNWYLRELSKSYTNAFHQPLAAAFYTEVHNKITHHKFTMYEPDWLKAH